MRKDTHTTCEYVNDKYKFEFLTVLNVDIEKKSKYSYVYIVFLQRRLHEIPYCIYCFWTSKLNFIIRYDKGS